MERRWICCVLHSDHESKLSDIWKVSPDGGDPVRVTTHGAVNDVVTRRGRPEVFAAVVNASGQFDIVQIKPDGSLTTVWQRTNAFPIDMTPRGDSLFIVESPKGGGGYTYRLIPIAGGGDGQVLLHPGEGLGYLSDDGVKLLYTIPNGSTADLGILNRADGTTRRLTTTPADERYAVMSPDGKTVFFQRARPSRRIAIADLSKVLEEQQVGSSYVLAFLLVAGPSSSRAENAQPPKNSVTAITISFFPALSGRYTASPVNSM